MGFVGWLAFSGRDDRRRYLCMRNRTALGQGLDVVSDGVERLCDVGARQFITANVANVSTRAEAKWGTDQNFSRPRRISVGS